MFRASLYPSSGEHDRILLHMVFWTGCVGCGFVELGSKLCALCEQQISSLYAMRWCGSMLPDGGRRPKHVGANSMLILI